jgi:hypothetical protein
MQHTFRTGEISDAASEAPVTHICLPKTKSMIPSMDNSSFAGLFT